MIRTSARNKVSRTSPRVEAPRVVHHRLVGKKWLFRGSRTKLSLKASAGAIPPDTNMDLLMGVTADRARPA